MSANEISFDTKISQSDCVSQPLLGQKENYSPATSTDFWRPNWNIIHNMTLKYDFFEMASVWSKK